MIPEVEKPRVTEIQVRMNCNGCVHKIKKALHGINGIYDLHIDFPNQKITIIGWADPDKIVKAIKKTRKIATICTHSEQLEPPPAQPEPAPETGAPAPEAANAPPPAEAANAPPPAEAAPQAEPPKDPSPPENPPPEATPSSTANANEAGQPSGPKEVEEVHVIYHHPPDYGYRFGYGHNYNGHWINYLNGPGVHHELPSGYRHEPPPPVYVACSYNTYKPSPYVTENEYVQSPPQYTCYSRPECYSYDHRSNGNGTITSMFSDENPNACRIV